MIVHDIRVEEGSIIVGATDLDRWTWEMEDDRRREAVTGVPGVSHAADAKTLVYVELTDPGRPYAVAETMGLHVDRSDPLRSIAVAAIPALFEAAWEIKERGWDLPAARVAIFGRRIDTRPDA